VLQPVPDGGTPIKRSVWVDPVADGNTPMVAGIRQASAVYLNWAERPRIEHGVILVHVTDGRPTDGEPLAVLAETKMFAQLVRLYGGTPLITNIHFDENTDSKPVLFPARPDGLGNREFLFLASSLMPTIFQAKALELGFTLPEDGTPRLFASQNRGGLKDLPRLLTIGTTPILKGK
jgi:hypothetical protein